MRRNWIANIIAALNQDCVVQASNASGAEDDIDLELDAGCREFCAEVDYDDHLATLRVAPEIIDGEKQVDVRVDCPIEEDMVKVCQEALRIEGPELEGLEVDVRISRVADGLCTFTAAYGCAVGAAEFVAVLILLSLFPADRTAEGLIAHLVMLVAGIRFLSGLELIPAAIEIMGPFFLVLTYIWQRYETRARERARHIRFHIR